MNSHNMHLMLLACQCTLSTNKDILLLLLPVHSVCSGVLRPHLNVQTSGLKVQGPLCQSTTGKIWTVI